MKGTFTYANQPLTAASILCGAFLTAVLMMQHPMIGLTMLFVTIILTALAGNISGSYSADEKCLTVKTFLKTHSFVYGEIRSVKTKIRHLGNSRWDDTFTAAAVLTLRTKQGEYVFSSRHTFSISDQLTDPAGFQKQLDELDFIQLGRYIEAQMGKVTDA